MVAQGELFQPQLFRCFRKGNFLFIRLELPRELQKAAVHPVLRCHAEIAEPVVEARTRSHEPNRDDVASVQRGMKHHDRLASGVIAAAQSQRAQHLSQRADGFQARAHPVFPPLGAQGVVRRQGSQFAIHLNGHVAPAGFDPRLNRHAIRGAGEFGAHAQRFLGQRRRSLPHGSCVHGSSSDAVWDKSTPVNVEDFFSSCSILRSFPCFQHDLCWC